MIFLIQCSVYKLITVFHCFNYYHLSAYSDKMSDHSELQIVIQTTI
jgi:hypothetical protein